ncbi:MAG: SUMF1/EgtB/PvdO family nonheme iron enzyme [Planctomycetes bacterium]|nr:SUMF1/EgtB/PvdO family nonheme iron enzyme [Planctomycetota bacterium]
MTSPEPAPPDPREDLPAASDQAILEIFRDMMELSAADIDDLEAAAHETRGWKTLDQLALEGGKITADQRDVCLRIYFDRRVEEIRGKLLGARIGSYHVLQEIACGGMGIVFRARQESPMFTRDVALKFMLADARASPEDRERFIAEVKGLAALSHPSCVHIFDSGIEADLYYFSMELVEGWSLVESSEAEKLSLERKADVVRDVARALAYLHENGVIHRDVKPGNIMVDRNGSTKLLDFGIAQFSADPCRRAVEAGTPYFMAPEVIDPPGGFGPVGPGTDIYALGAVLFQLVYGRAVFEVEGDGGLAQILERTVTEPPRFPSGRWPRVPYELERIAARCLQKRVADRYATASELAEDLDAFLRRLKQRTPVRAAATALGFAAALIAVTAMVREPTPAPPVPPAVDLSPWRHRVEEVEDVDSEAAGGLRKALDAIEAQDGPGAVPGTDLVRIAEEVNAFWRAVVARALEEATRAKQEYLKVPVPEDERLRKLYEDGVADLSRALTRKPDKAAHDWLEAAQVKFEEALVAAESLRLASEREAERTRTQAAREGAVRARAEVDEGKLVLSASASEAFEAGSRDMERAGELLEAGDFDRARGPFEAAERGFVRARHLGDVGFEARHAELQGAVRRAGQELESQSARFQKNLVPAEWRELQGLLEQAGDALGRRRLPEAEKSLAGLTAKLEEAQAALAARRRAAEEEAARVPSPPRGEPWPEAAMDLLTRAREARKEGAGRLEAEEHEAARRAFQQATRGFGAALARRAELTEGMVWVRGSEEVPGFWMDRCEVTVGQYRELLQEVERRGHGRCCPGGGARRHEPFDWAAQRRPELPVVGVRLEDARVYARWRGKDLPSVGMWRLAARTGKRAGDLRTYPFGDMFDPRRVCFDRGDGRASLMPADSLPEGKSACGCLHLAGNAAEWALLPSGEGALLGGSYLTAEKLHLTGLSAYSPRVPFEESEGARRTAGFRCVLRAVQEAGP